MVPLKLTLKNFLSYGENAAALDFSSFRVACLSGRNGHGKSALIDAMTWALWGRCRVKTNEEVIKRGASEARVEFDFESEGVTYRIIRSLTKRKSKPHTSLDLQIFDGETGSFSPIDQGAKSRATIESILKMDYNSFICSSFILQGMADEFTRRTPAERKDVLSRILDLEEYETLAKRARDLALDGGYKIDALGTEAENLKEEVAKRESCETRLAESRLGEEKVSRELGEFEAIYGGLIREHESLNAKLEALNKLLGDKKQAVERLERLSDERARLDALIQKDAGTVSREAEILNTWREYERLGAEEKALGEKQVIKINLERECESLGSRIAAERSEIEHRIKTIEAKIEGQEKIIESARKTLERRDVIEKGFGKLKDALSELARLDNKREEADRIAEDEAVIRNNIGQRRLELELRLKELAARSKELSSRSGREGALEKDVKRLKSLISQHEEEGESGRALKEELKRSGEDKKGLVTRKSEIQKRKAEEETKLDVLNAESDKAHCPLCESPLGAEATSALAEKLTAAISAYERELGEIDLSIRDLRAREDALSAGIKKADSSTALLPALHKELGEKEQGLRDSLTASRELVTNESLKNEIGNELKSEGYKRAFEPALKEIDSRKSALGYDVREHEDLKNEIEGLRGFDSEYRLLVKEKERTGDALAEIGISRAALAPLGETLEKGSFAEGLKSRLLEIKNELDALCYDEKRHGDVKKALASIEYCRQEKAALDEARVNLTHREGERTKLSERIDEEKARLSSLEREISGLEGTEARIGEVRRSITSSEQRLSSLRSRKDELMVEISRSESALERIDGLEARKKELEREAAETARGVRIYRELSKAFGKNGLQALIIEHAVPEIEVEANRILGRLTEGGMSLTLEMVKPTQKGGERETLEIYIGDNSGTRSYETFSGGEAFRIDFSLRVAISKFIANRSGAQLRTLVIDEGFGTQDKDGLDHFVQVINSIAGDFDMILAITHVDELKERFPVRIEVTKEPGSGSRFEVVHN